MFTHSFYARRSRKRKKQLELTVFFALLGSASEKAARKMLVKLTPGPYHDLKVINQTSKNTLVGLRGKNCEPYGKKARGSESKKKLAVWQTI